MKVELEVVGGTNRQVRANVKLNGEAVGQLLIERADFTRFCDLVCKEEYTVKNSAQETKT